MKFQGWIAIDQTINAWFFKGWADETISARAYRNSVNGKPKWVIFERWIDRLFFWQVKHCEQSYRSEAERLHVPPMYRSIYNENNK